MKPTAKVIPFDLRRRRALDKAHAHEVHAACADFQYSGTGYTPQPLDWLSRDRSRPRALSLKPSTRKPDERLP